MKHSTETRAIGAKRHFHGFAVLVAITLLCVAVLSPLLKAPFLYDDYSVLQRDPFIARAFGKRVPPIDILDGLLFRSRPVRSLTHRLDARVAGSSTTWPHAVNVAMHMAAGLAFFSLLGGLGCRRSVRFVALTLFLVHPVCVDSVGIVSHRKEILSAFFLLMALKWSLSDRRHAWIPASISFLLAVFSKETAIVFPALWLLLRLAPRQSDCRAADDKRTRASQKTWREFVGWTALTVATALLAYWQIHRGLSILHADPSLDPNRAGHFGPGASWFLVVSAAIRAFPRYLLSFVIPWGHCAEPAFSLDVGLASWKTLGAATCGAFYAAALLSLWRRHSALFAPAAWIAVALSPYLFPPLLHNGGTAVFCDRYAYLACLGFAWLVAEALSWFADRGGPDKNRGLKRAAIAIVLTAIVTCEAQASFVLGRDFRDEVSFWRRVCRLNPGSFQASLNLAVAEWQEHKDYEAARAEFQRMYSIHSAFPFGLAAFADFLAFRHEWETALQVVDEGLSLAPRHPRLNAVRRKILHFCDPKPPESAEGVIVFGDSVPHGEHAQGPDSAGPPLSARISTLLGGIPALDASVSGSSSAVLSRELPLRLRSLSIRVARPPAWCVIWTGHNDAFFDRRPQEILRNVSRCVYLVREAGCKPLVIGPIPVRDAPGRYRGRQEKTLAALDSLLRRYCTETGVTFLSARQTLCARKEPAGGWLVESDGNHLNDAGLDCIAEACADVLRQTPPHRRRNDTFGKSPESRRGTPASNENQGQNK